MSGPSAPRGETAYAGLTLFSLGATFNYLVSLFHECPIRQGLFGRPILNKPLEQHFGWAGLVAMAAGMALGILSLVFSLQGWPIYRVWFYLLAAEMSLISGLQLVSRTSPSRLGERIPRWSSGFWQT